MARKTRWEYCAVRSDFGIEYFSPTGDHRHEKHGEEEKDFHKSIAVLGHDGWEMIGLAARPDSKVFMCYFKREL